MNDCANTGHAAISNGQSPFLPSNSPTELTTSAAQQHQEGGTQALQAGLLDNTIVSYLERKGQDDFHGIVDDLTNENKELQRELRLYKRLHHAPVHEEALFKVHVYSLLPEQKHDLMCLLHAFVADLRKTPQSDIYVGVSNSPTFPKLQRKLVSPPDGSAQSKSCDCGSTPASTCSRQSCSIQNPSRLEEQLSPGKEDPRICMRGSSMAALRRWDSATSGVRTKVAQEVEPVPSAGSSSADVSIAQTTKIASNDQQTLIDDQKEHWKGRPSIARWIGDSLFEDHVHLAHLPQPGASDTTNVVTGSGHQKNASSQRRSDGSIIFYVQASFYTDLSGDMGSGRVKDRDYDRVSEHPIGARTHIDSFEAMRRLEHQKGPLSQPDLDSAGVSDPTSSLVVNDIDGEAFAVEPLCQSSVLWDTSNSPEFSVSGLGGVVPSDHFSITIRSYLDARNDNVVFPTRATQHSRPYRLHILRALGDSPGAFRLFSTSSSEKQSCLVLQRRTIDFQVKKLLPSCLPPPSYYGYESSEEDEEPEYIYDSTQESERPA